MSDKNELNKNKKDYGLDDEEVLSASVVKKTEENRQKRKIIIIIVSILVAIAVAASLLVRTVFFTEAETMALQFSIGTIYDPEDEHCPNYLIDPEDASKGTRRDNVVIGEKFRSTFSLTNITYEEDVDSVPVFVRFSAHADVEELGSQGLDIQGLINVNIEGTGGRGWTYFENDSSFYYNGILGEGETTLFTTMMEITPTDTLPINLLQGQTLKVSMAFDMVQADPGLNALIGYWGENNVPQDWLSDIQNL